eukprot:598943-Pyramimonas_sp.AAC.1
MIGGNSNGRALHSTTQMITDNTVLVTVAEEKWGHLPAWRNLQDMDATGTHHAPSCSTDEDGSYALNFDEHGQC